MSRNYYTLKTGHKASDRYFKNQPLWCDSDILKSLIIGISIGGIFATFVFLA